jgi:RimJ/RimL family protein N-acetyltransferase
VTDAGRLRGRIVELAALRDEDAPLLYEWINDRDLVTLSAPFREVSRTEHDEWLNSVRSRQDMCIFGIRLLDGDRLVGSCQLHSIHPVHRSTELQIRIGASDARGRGIGTEATRLLLQYGFQQLDLHRIYLYVFESNEAARRLYARVGFRTEGVLREAARIDDSWRNSLVMAILQSEYRADR